MFRTSAHSVIDVADGRSTYACGRPGSNVLSWVLAVGFIVSAIAFACVGIYRFAAPLGFAGGEYTTMVDLQDKVAWNRQGITYAGPIFVLESLFVVGPGLAPASLMVPVNFVLFAAAFLCVWLALGRGFGIRALLVVLGLWLVHQATIIDLGTNEHLEILELAGIAGTLLLLTRYRDRGAGALLGIATMVKILPGIFIPYFVLIRKWTFALSATVSAGLLLLVVCWIQRITPWRAVYEMLYQSSVWTYSDTSIGYRSPYMQGVRPAMSRMLVRLDPALSAGGHNELVIVGASVISVAAAVTVIWTLMRTRSTRSERSYGLEFGLICSAMLLITPQGHMSYYVLVLPAFTAAFLSLIKRQKDRWTGWLWVGFAASYGLSAFRGATFAKFVPQPLAAIQRVSGIDMGSIFNNWELLDMATVAMILLLALITVLLLNDGMPKTNESLRS